MTKILLGGQVRTDVHGMPARVRMQHRADTCGSLSGLEGEGAHGMSGHASRQQIKATSRC